MAGAEEKALFIDPEQSGFAGPGSSGDELVGRAVLHPVQLDFGQEGDEIARGPVEHRARTGELVAAHRDEGTRRRHGDAATYQVPAFRGTV
ncbi:MAG: hypothetical protein WD990_06510, partial [Acidimicrobiia bacterium]